jgi:hypothetical protein
MEVDGWPPADSAYAAKCMTRTGEPAGAPVRQAEVDHRDFSTISWCRFQVCTVDV